MHLSSSHFFAIFVALAVLAPRMRTRAQDGPRPHPRSVQVTFLMQPATAAVLVSEDAVWAPVLPGQALSICAAGHRCVPVTSAETCAPPRCPGPGSLLLTSTPVREDVGDFPEDVDDWKEEIAAMRLDPALASLLGSYVGSHPDDHESEPVVWVSDETEEELGYELRLGLLTGGLVTQGGAYVGAEFSAAVRYAFHKDEDDGYDDDSLSVLDTAFGDSIALELRVAVHDLRDTQGDGKLSTSLGMGISGANVMDGGRFRIASIISAVLPELGVFFRPDYTAAFYARFSFPIAWAASDSVGLELRPSLAIVSSWIDGPTNEVLMDLSLGAIIH